jgi:hypothetical protein
MAHHRISMPLFDRGDPGVMFHVTFLSAMHSLIPFRCIHLPNVTTALKDQFSDVHGSLFQPEAVQVKAVVGELFSYFTVAVQEESHVNEMNAGILGGNFFDESIEFIDFCPIRHFGADAVGEDASHEQRRIDRQHGQKPYLSRRRLQGDRVHNLCVFLDGPAAGRLLLKIVDAKEHYNTAGLAGDDLIQRVEGAMGVCAAERPVFDAAVIKIFMPFRNGEKAVADK